MSKQDFEYLLQNVATHAKEHLRAYSLATPEEWIHYQEGILDALTMVDAIRSDQEGEVLDVLNTVYNSKRK